MTLRSFAWTVVCAVLAAPQVARATVVEGQSFEKMAAGAKVIVRGVVGAQQARWDDERRRIYTYTEVRVSSVLKGDASAFLLVRQPGGEVDGIGQRVSGVATFHSGEEVLLFLEVPPDDEGVFVVRALTAGKIRLAKNTFGELRATRDLRGIAFYDPSAPKPAVRELNEVEDLGDAEAFVRRIQKAVKAAEGASR